MGAEITLSGALKLVLGEKSEEWALGPLTDDIVGTNYAHLTQTINVSATEEVFNKGDVGTPGWIIARNNSTTVAEIVYIMTATSGVNMVELVPGGLPVLFKFPAALTAPFIISATGTPEIEYFLIER
jgi:hypothetical protein